METIIVKKINESFLYVDCDAGHAMELNDYFSFYVNGYKFMPLYKNGLWDGRIKLFNSQNRKLLVGLLPDLIKFCNERQYNIVYSKDEFSTNDYSMKELVEHVYSLELKDNKGEPLIPHKEQLEAFIDNVNNRRSLTIVPTGGGKSLIAFLLATFYIKNYSDKVLLIVPTTSLVEQMTKDFDSYSPKFNADDLVHKIYSGKEKVTDKPIIVSTWQSIFKNRKNWFLPFGMIIGDEVHTFKAKSLIHIMESAENAEFRTGLTGTLDGTLTSEMQLKGLFGKVKKYVTTKELIERGVLSKLFINKLLLKYPDDLRKVVSKFNYASEMKFITECEERTNFIVELGKNLKGNTIIAFKIVKHGEEIFEKLRSSGKDNVYFVSGKVATTDRERIREIVEKEKDAIIVASIGCFSTGINIRNIHNIVFAAPMKSLIKVLQTIGRGLRKSDNGATTVLYDISDDLQWKSKKNFSLKHGAERLKIYAKEKFNFKVTEIKL